MVVLGSGRQHCPRRMFQTLELTFVEGFVPIEAGMTRSCQVMPAGPVGALGAPRDPPGADPAFFTRLKCHNKCTKEAPACRISFLPRECSAPPPLSGFEGGLFL